MPYSRETEYPGSLMASADLSSPLVVAAAGIKIKVSSIVVSNEGGGAAVFGIANGAGSVFIRLPVPSGESFELSRGFQFDSGCSITAISGTATAMNAAVFSFDAS